MGRLLLARGREWLVLRAACRRLFRRRVGRCESKVQCAESVSEDAGLPGFRRAAPGRSGCYVKRVRGWAGMVLCPVLRETNAGETLRSCIDCSTYLLFLSAHWGLQMRAAEEKKEVRNLARSSLIPLAIKWNRRIAFMKKTTHIYWLIRRWLRSEHRRRE